MIRRVLFAVATPVVALIAAGPIVDRLARRLTQAPRTLPGEVGLRPAVEALGGEVVRLRSRDGLRLQGRWIPAESEGATASGDEAAEATPALPDDGGWVPDPREAILLLHGYSGSIVPDLVELAPFLRRTAGVLGLDFRGHGGSDDAPTTFGLHEVEDVAGALAWLGERGVRRVALLGSSMGAVTALAAVAVLGDGRLAAADADPDAPAATVEAPTPRIVAVVVEAAAPELAGLVGRRVGAPYGTGLANRAFGRMARMLGGDPRDTEPIRTVRLVEDVPLLLIQGGADPSIPARDADRLAQAAPDATRLVIPDAGHGTGHATDPARYEAAVTTHLRSGFRVARS